MASFGRDADGTKTMIIWNQIALAAQSIREFVAPTYHPEQHYMRGPGPACARRISLETRVSFH